ncbi:hypothetical protein V1514DRAFT_325578 [Lipomyces japonicus]|uniref:uncharacterized protein n=1 Tax=Lipomyces japonicus TaxID=56871 RepID=UPI0034CDDEEC
MGPRLGVKVENVLNGNRPERDEDTERTAKRTRVDDPYAGLRTQLDTLNKNPNRKIYIPQLKTPSERIKPPPAFVSNVQGSSSGAGSGEFHVYKEARRREMAREKAFEEERTKERVTQEFNERRQALKEKDAERTAKKREQRRKRKGLKNTAKPQNATHNSDQKKVSKTIDVTKELENITANSDEKNEAPIADGEINLTIFDDFDL